LPAARGQLEGSPIRWVWVRTDSPGGRLVVSGELKQGQQQSPWESLLAHLLSDAFHKVRQDRRATVFHPQERQAHLNPAIAYWPKCHTPPYKNLNSLPSDSASVRPELGRSVQTAALTGELAWRLPWYKLQPEWPWQSRATYLIPRTAHGARSAISCAV
jgi:hypothetical protein